MTNTYGFTENEDVQIKVIEYSDSSIEFALQHFGILLDYSESSIVSVELALNKMHLSYISTNPTPTEDQVESFTKCYGSYIGEIYRRHHGATWGLVEMNGQKFPGLMSKSGFCFWPWGKAFNRVVNGDEDNIVFYYKVIVERGNADRASEPTDAIKIRSSIAPAGRWSAFKLWFYGLLRKIFHKTTN